MKVDINICKISRWLLLSVILMFTFAACFAYGMTDSRRETVDCRPETVDCRLQRVDSRLQIHCQNPEPCTRCPEPRTQYPAPGTQYPVSSNINTNPFQYSGYYLDAPSGLYYLNARYYSPELRRFISRDSYDLSNRYTYCDGSPVFNVDRTGHLGSEELIGLAALFAVGIVEEIVIPEYVPAIGAETAVLATELGTEGGVDAASVMLPEVPACIIEDTVAGSDVGIESAANFRMSELSGYNNVFTEERAGITNEETFRKDAVVKSDFENQEEMLTQNRKVSAIEPGDIDADEKEKPIETKEENNCPICLEHADVQHIRTLLCGHQFHEECIDRWLQDNNTCPLCRAPVDGENPSISYDLDGSYDDYGGVSPVAEAWADEIDWSDVD